MLKLQQKLITEMAASRDVSIAEKQVRQEIDRLNQNEEEIKALKPEIEKDRKKYKI